MQSHEKLIARIFNKNYKKISLRRNNYIAFSIIYFSINFIQIYIMVYIPLFHLNVLNINRVNLSLTQFISYLFLFLLPLAGFFFDKYSKYKKVLICSFGPILSLNFLIFNFFSTNILYYGVFLSISMLTQATIRTGASKLLLEVPNEKIERNIMMLINISSVIGLFLPSLLFKVCLVNINNLVFWNLFFIIGWVISTPILLLFLFIRDNNQIHKKQNNHITAQTSQNSSRSLPIIVTSFIFLANFLLWSDKLISYPFSSWINSQFGKKGFSFYSDFYIVFSVSGILGIYLGKRLLQLSSHKAGNYLRRYKINLCFIILSSLIYIFALYCLLLPNLIFFLLFYTIINFLGGIFILFYTKFFLEISRNGRNENFRFWIMSLSSNLATLFFIPLGTLLSIFYSVEVLILFVIVCTFGSVISIFLAYLTLRSGFKKVDYINPIV